MKWTNLSTILLFTMLIYSFSLSSNSKLKGYLKQNNTNTSENLFLTSLPEQEEDPALQKFFIKTNITCNKTTCPGKSICSDKNTCECAHGYANIADSGVFCTYEQKKQLYAFFLEVSFLGGMGHLYAGRVAHGIIKLILIILLPIILFYSAYWSKWNPIVMIVSTTICCGITIWHLVDVILIGMNKYMDGNGVPLVRW